MPETGHGDLQTLPEDGDPPETRMSSAQGVQDFIRRLIQNDDKRGRKRAMVAGLVDGNPPYSWRKLRDVGRPDAANFNTGTARAFLESGDGAFYDLFSQATQFVTFDVTHGSPQQRVDWARIMMEEANDAVREDDDFDNDIQLSQQQMVLNGCGPLYFEDEHSIFPMSIETGDLVLPDKTRSKVGRWEVAGCLWDYYPPELYGKIRNEKIAGLIGWDVAYTKNCIARAVDVQQPDSSGKSRDWEFYQNQMKSNSLEYVGNDNLVIKTAHVFWKEFTTGRITHAIIERNAVAKGSVKYLYFKHSRYASFKDAINPMYFDKGRGGYHHNVTGLGVKMFSMLEHQNRQICDLMDKSNAPKQLLKAGTAEGATKLQMVRMGLYAIVPPGTEAVQTSIQGFIPEGLQLYRTCSELVTSNLSQYRQQVAPDGPGNPPTKYQKQLEAAQQSALSATTFSRYLKQLDVLYKVMVPRMFNPNTTDERAKTIQRNCRDRGVPRECFGRIRNVMAARSMGQGSGFMRQQAVQAIGEVIGGCSEDGQENWRNDFIAAHGGQASVHRYNPRKQNPNMSTQQRERAMNQVVGMKMGMPTTISPDQNPATFAGAFLEAATAALNSLEKGADKMEIFSFLSLVGPAIHKHIKRMEADPLRKQIVPVLLKQWQRVAVLTDKLKDKIQKEQKSQQEKRGQMGQVVTDAAIKAAKVDGDLKLKAAKQQATLQMQAQKHKQQLAIADAQSASTIHNNKLRAFQE